MLDREVQDPPVRVWTAYVEVWTHMVVPKHFHPLIGGRIGPTVGHTYTHIHTVRWTQTLGEQVRAQVHGKTNGGEL